MSIVETPSKAAAAALSIIDLNAPKPKPADSSLLAKLKAVAAEAPVKPFVVEQAKGEVEEYRKRFVGDLNCTEKDEPLLKETTSRFVIFPINYREVSLIPSAIMRC